MKAMNLLLLGMIFAAMTVTAEAQDLTAKEIVKKALIDKTSREQRKEVREKLATHVYSQKFYEE